ncbi:hypothetical protein KP509_24G011800 [Ceratopteris richardii]|uniref:Uncharacterized protein n=1 Tax=Ceratopteris richardii TaxID=49495 RepID=A0A8T2RSM6_CERRI|nr:hypothetical protein KP509_24G011800 [Ceratopteris richardii]
MDMIAKMGLDSLYRQWEAYACIGGGLLHDGKWLAHCTWPAHHKGFWQGQGPSRQLHRVDSFLPTVRKLPRCGHLDTICQGSCLDPWPFFSLHLICTCDFTPFKLPP